MIRRRLSAKIKRLTRREPSASSGQAIYRSACQGLIEHYGLESLGSKRLARELKLLSRANYLWLLEPRSSLLGQAPRILIDQPLDGLLAALLDPQSYGTVFCPLISPELLVNDPTQDSLPYQGRTPAVLLHLDRAAAGQEADTPLFIKSHLRHQFQAWNQPISDGISLLTSLAELRGSLRRHVSPHPLFDWDYFKRERTRLIQNHQPSLRLPPLLDYLLSCQHDPLHRLLNTAIGFNPTLWTLYSSHCLDSPLRQVSFAPLVNYVLAMQATKTSFCVVLDQRLIGSVDSLDQNGTLHGWCHFPRGMEQSPLLVFINGIQLGTGIANLPRPDVQRPGVDSINCGFSISLDLERVSLSTLLDLSASCFQVVTVDYRYALGRGAWLTSPKDRRILLSEACAQEMSRKNYNLIDEWLIQERDISAIGLVRYSTVQAIAAFARAGSWDVLSVNYLFARFERYPRLQSGTEQSSCARAEIVLISFCILSACFDQDGIFAYNVSLSSVDVADQLGQLSSHLNELCYFGPTLLEAELWEHHLQPLAKTVLATLFLQHSFIDLTSLHVFIRSLVNLVDRAYEDVEIAAQFVQLISKQPAAIDSHSLHLMLRREQLNPPLFTAYAVTTTTPVSPAVLLEYSLALVELSQYSIPTMEASFAQISPHIPGWLKVNSRSSSLRLKLDQLGIKINDLCNELLDRLLSFYTYPEAPAALRQRTCLLLDAVSSALWMSPDSICLPHPQSTVPYHRWLLIGENNLPQCWLYRVEQKQHQLQALGAEVRSIDYNDLSDWSFTQLIEWSEAVIFCRTPSLYPVIRTLRFAVHMGKAVFADFDDLIFTHQFPPPFESYASGITLKVHRRLKSDYPLHHWLVQNVNTIVVSTQLLRDALERSIESSGKNLCQPDVRILTNQPPDELLKASLRSVRQGSNQPFHLVVTSGTLAHKQIWLEVVGPALDQLMFKYSSLKLTIIGHLPLPPSLHRYQDRVRLFPFLTYSQYLNVLAQASICLVPLESHPTTLCKSPIKLIESALLGLACICSPIESYTTFAEEDHHILCARTTDEWVSKASMLLESPHLTREFAQALYQHVSVLTAAEAPSLFWDTYIPDLSVAQFQTVEDTHAKSVDKRQPTKVLVVHVFFAPQSIGGATRIVQDHVLTMMSDPHHCYDVTVLCADHDCWQPTESDVLPLDSWSWHGAKVVRLAIPSRSWADIQDRRVERFCRNWFLEQQFDLIDCHCCQIITASPLIVARDLGIPYHVTFHDAWWLSPELFLVSPSGRLIDPSDPFDHIDGQPTDIERVVALQRRAILLDILRDAKELVAVSNSCQRLYQMAGIDDVLVKENQPTSMAREDIVHFPAEHGTIRICHIGGMALHKGYHILREAVHMLPPSLNLAFNIVDHKLSGPDDSYISHWNGYPIRFIPPVPMSDMPSYYANQDVLVAPSIWPESFGLVTREALSAGMKVIASDIGALADPIKSSLHGQKVRAGNPDDLAQAIVKVVSQIRGVTPDI
jgi:glycosyltransferase involved in cell wall biosynthesis